ncbi:MAG: two-component system sensor histidine kinase NtrB [Thermodesulfobacteriota bacterium]
MDPAKLTKSYESLAAELSAIYEFSSLGFSKSEEDLADMVIKKVPRLFSVRYLALFWGLKDNQHLIASWGFQTEQEIPLRMRQEKANQFLFPSRGQHLETQIVLFMEQAHPIHNREKRLYTLFAQRLEEALLPMTRARERIQAEKEKRRLEVQLIQIQKMEAIATLAGGIAHEFNNALSVMVGYLDLLELHYSDDQRSGDFVKPMKASAFRMAELTNQLLAYARGGQYETKRISLSDFVKDTLPVIKHSIPSEIQISTDLPYDISSLEIDPTQMQMVLSAIMTNASEAMKDSGSIRIKIRNQELDKQITQTHNGLPAGPYVCLMVEDDGKGMDEETKKRIFEPFFTTKLRGRGLGMAAVYGIVKNHRGWIEVDSELSKGTIVRIFLPALGEEIEKA